MITKLAFIAQPCRDLDGAKAFYGGLLGLAHDGDFPGWAEFTTPDGAIVALDTYSPKEMQHPSPYMALETDDLDGELARLAAAGVTVAKEAWTNTEPGGAEGCRMAVILDPDGNPILLHQLAADRV